MTSRIEDRPELTSGQAKNMKMRNFIDTHGRCHNGLHLKVAGASSDAS
jgi:hypothetical protein